MTKILIYSFGYGHDQPPTADLTIDLRDFFRDPHIDPALRQMTANDQAIIDKVLSTSGVRVFTGDLASLLAQLARSNDVTAALGCAGGRRRAPVIADATATILHSWGYEVEVVHRDLDKPVIQR